MPTRVGSATLGILLLQSDNSETFVGLCLLTVAGAALATQSLGFSDTLGAFTAGVLLSESNFKTQVLAMTALKRHTLALHVAEFLKVGITAGTNHNVAT
ncbi:K(+) efflux antiporter 3 chloroplastic [Haematococcus lacustris]|uniref:K(+) efflux antiporter 3 chloroplastic n=1 Tax=Haematococcus lacustris TaxID=44745 RepID=A0A699YVD1_HAELA|nr:K(+) efflux antiporter 3 chloroplastic [Haematococcus lacustris]